MTGFFICSRGASLANASRTARFAKVFIDASFIAVVVIARHPTYRIIVSCSATGPSARAGNMDRAPMRRMTTMSRNTNMALLVESVPALVATFLRAASEPARHSVAATGDEAVREHLEAEDRVDHGRVGGKTRERRAVVSACGDSRVENFGEAVGTAVVEAVDRRGIEAHDARADQDDNRRGDAQDGRHAHLARTDLLTEVLRRASHHKPRDEHRQDDESGSWSTGRIRCRRR